jgi:hypothetical protein
VVRRPGNEVLALLDKTGRGQCLVAVTGTGLSTAGVSHFSTSSAASNLAGPGLGVGGPGHHPDRRLSSKPCRRGSSPCICPFASREASGSEHLRRPLQVGPQPTHPVHQSISGHSEVCGDIAVSPAVYNPAFQQDAVVISQIPEEGAKPIRGIVHSGDLGGHETGVSVVRLGRRSPGRLRGWCSR